jgi:hypothetical protein
VHLKGRECGQSVRSAAGPLARPARPSNGDRSEVRVRDTVPTHSATGPRVVLTWQLESVCVQCEAEVCTLLTGCSELTFYLVD